MEITAGGFPGPAGVYPVILVSIGEPESITLKQGPDAGTSVKVRPWVFAVEAGEFEGEEIKASTSMATSPSSKAFSWITALLGKAPAIGDKLDFKQLVGRSALANMQPNDRGYIGIAGLMGVPVAPARRAAEPAAAATDGAPF